MANHKHRMAHHFHISTMLSMGKKSVGARVMMKAWLALLDRLDQGREVVELQWNTKEIWRCKLAQLDEEHPIPREIYDQVRACMPPLLCGFVDIKAGLHLWVVLIEVGQSTSGVYAEKAINMHPVSWAAGILAIFCQLDLCNRRASDDVMFGVSFGRTVLSMGFSESTIPTSFDDAIAYWKRIICRVVDQRLAHIDKIHIFNYNLSVAENLPIPASRNHPFGVDPNADIEERKVDADIDSVGSVFSDDDDDDETCYDAYEIQDDSGIYNSDSDQYESYI